MPHVVDVSQTGTFVHRFDSLTNADVSVLGGKNASFGKMIGALKEGIRVPDGFATTAETLLAIPSRQRVAGSHSYRIWLKDSGMEVCKCEGIYVSTRYLLTDQHTFIPQRSLRSWYQALLDDGAEGGQSPQDAGRGRSFGGRYPPGRTPNVPRDSRNDRAIKTA